MAVALAGQLREGTKKSHTMAENTGFVACFLKGVVEKKSYRKLISDLYFVYEAMDCLLYTSPSPRDATLSRMPSSA